METFRCKACNKELKRGDTQCPECGSKDIMRIFIRIAFIEPSVEYPFSAHKGMKLGRDNFRLYKEYKYLEKEQFEVIKSNDGWKIKGLPGVTNPTFLNDMDITNQTVDLKDGDTIRVGKFEVKVKFIESKEEIPK
jgi:phage FluMu protein Com